jgi:hypothetical protein
MKKQPGKGHLARLVGSGYNVIQTEYAVLPGKDDRVLNWISKIIERSLMTTCQSRGNPPSNIFNPTIAKNRLENKCFIVYKCVTFVWEIDVCSLWIRF